MGKHWQLSPLSLGDTCTIIKKWIIKQKLKQKSNNNPKIIQLGPFREQRFHVQFNKKKCIKSQKEETYHKWIITCKQRKFTNWYVVLLPKDKLSDKGKRKAHQPKFATAAALTDYPKMSPINDKLFCPFMRPENWKIYDWSLSNWENPFRFNQGELNFQKHPMRFLLFHCIYYLVTVFKIVLCICDAIDFVIQKYLRIFIPPLLLIDFLIFFQNKCKKHQISLNTNAFYPIKLMSYQTWHHGKVFPDKTIEGAKQVIKTNKQNTHHVVMQGMQNRFVLHFVQRTTLPLSFLWHWWHIKDSTGSP